MSTNEINNKRLKIQEFRFGVIADLLNPYLKKQEFQDLLVSKAQRKYVIPYSQKNSITAATIRSWIKLFNEQGMNGLLPQIRTDKGKAKSLSDSDQHELIEYLESHPDVSALTAVRELQKIGKVKFGVSQSSISRFVRAQGLTRKKRSQEHRSEFHRKYEYEHLLECIQADAMHGFAIPDSSGKKKKAILLAFIDDASRRIVYANFAFTERSIEFEKGIKHILATHGRIGRLYTDNGSTFISAQTQRILAILGLPLIHSRPGKPAGRGKIERFFRTVRDQFLRPLDKDSITSIEQLNVKFKTWLEGEYHRNPHRGLKNQTPIEYWISKVHCLVTLSPHIELDEVFQHELKRKVYKDNTFSLDGTLYEVPIMLENPKIKIRYNPESKNSIKVFSGETYLTDAKVVDTYANAKIIRNRNTKTIEQDYVGVKTKKQSLDESHNVHLSLAASRIQGGQND